MAIRRECLETFPDKASAQAYRDQIAHQLRRKGITAYYGVSIQYRPSAGIARPWWVMLRTYDEPP